LRDAILSAALSTFSSLSPPLPPCRLEEEGGREGGREGGWGEGTPERYLYLQYVGNMAYMLAR